METDSDFKAIAKKMVKGKKATPKVAKSKEPTVMTLCTSQLLKLPSSLCLYIISTL